MLKGLVRCGHCGRAMHDTWTAGKGRSAKKHRHYVCNKGAVTQALLMSVYRTLKLRSQDPVQTVAAALRTYTATGHLPPLPVQFVADG